MRYIFILVFALLASCTAELIYNESEYDCGIVIGGDDIDNVYRLKVSYPDGEYWHVVTKKAYEHYNMFDDICFNTIKW